MSPPRTAGWTAHDDRLTGRQIDLLEGWFPGAVIEQDHTWAIAQRVVLQVRQGPDRFIVKAGRGEDHHMDREIAAHQQWLAPWVDQGRAPRAVHLDHASRLLVSTYLPGDLVLGHPAQDDPDTYEQAGHLLAQLHGQSSVRDTDAEARLNARALAWLASPHRIAPATAETLRTQIESWPTPTATLVPTHGDWQPRNWLVHDGRLSVIDFGRADLRPAMTDLGRLAAQDFARDPRLEAAFLRGYGPDPRDPAAWHRTRLREAIGTAVWAHQVGDETFEAQGHAMIAAALDPAGTG